MTQTVQDRRKNNRPHRIDYSKLESEESVRRWISFASLRPATKAGYLWLLRDFLVRYSVPRLGLKESADALLSWARGQQDLDTVLLAVIDYGENYTPLYSQQKVINTLRSFFTWNKLELPPKKQRQFIKSWHRGYKRSEIQTLLGFLDDRRQKLYVLVAKDSGLRASHILSIRYKHLKQDLEEARDGFVAIRFEPEYYTSSKSASITFLGPESISYLREMIKDGLVKSEPEARIFWIDDSTVSESLDIAKRKAGIPQEVQPSHGIRKFYHNCLLKLEGLPQDRLNQLDGHAQGTNWHYNERDVEEGGPLREWYRKAYPFLDLSEKGAVDQRFQEQQVEIERLKKELEKRDKKLEELGFTVQMMMPDLREIVQWFKKKTGRRAKE